MPLFRSKNNLEYIKRKNKQLVEHVVGEKITYYGINKEFTRENIYGEAKEKIWNPPIEVKALVRWKEQQITTTKFGQDQTYNISFYPLLDTLTELNLAPTEGDFVEYDSKFFEIASISYPLQMLGVEEQAFYTKLDCVTAREGVFSTNLSGTPDDALRTRPDEKLSSSFYYSDVMFPFSSSR
jgi:hypothetical protein